MTYINGKFNIWRGKGKKGSFPFPEINLKKTKHLGHIDIAKYACEIMAEHFSRTYAKHHKMVAEERGTNVKFFHMDQGHLETVLRKQIYFSVLF